MFREGTCPKCHEKIQVPDDRKKIICMYCGEEISVSRALGEQKETSSEAYTENQNHALEGLNDLIRTCHKPMQNFKRDLYEGVFDTFYASHRHMLEAMEYVYQYTDDPDNWLQKMTECILNAAGDDLDTYRFKGQKSQRLLDHNFLLSVYLIPAVLKYPAEMSEPFADLLIASWNDTFHTSIGKARYDDINNGFRRKLCYITTAVCEYLGHGSDCYELQLLKDYRDHYLDITPQGHALVEEYYNIAPTIVKRINRQPDRSRVYQRLYEDYLLPCIRCIEAKDYEACMVGYREMVLALKEAYMN